MSLFNDVPLVGSFYRGRDIADFVATLQPGAMFTLEREPENEHDGYAIKVLHDGVHVGYVARNIAMWLAPKMDDGFQPHAVMTSMGANSRNKPEPWLSIGEEESIDLVCERLKDGTYVVGEDPLDEPAPKRRHIVHLNERMEPIEPEDDYTEPQGHTSHTFEGSED